MAGFISFVNLISLLVVGTNYNYQTFIDGISSIDQQILTENNINDWDSLHNYILNEENIYSSPNNGNSNPISDAIYDVQEYLNNSYPDFIWSKDVRNSKYTNDVSAHIPVDMQDSTLFPQGDIEKAIYLAGVQDKTDYGGCGPIAIMGILDYFARYLGYSEIMSDPTDSSTRISLATEVLSNTYFSVFSSTEKGTLVWPGDVSKTFKTVIKNHGLEGIIHSQCSTSLFGNDKTRLLNFIKESIKYGLPVTLYVGTACGDGSFAKHYTNVFGYETWMGISTQNPRETKIKTFLQANLNWGVGSAYCDSNILNYPLVGIITYSHILDNVCSFSAIDFAEEFINSSGNGQYFFDNRFASVNLSNGENISTNRMRASYIENQYLVLSPYRQNAGLAYIDLSFDHPVHYMSFGATLWSNSENILGESFKLQYWDEGWQDHIQIDLNQLFNLKLTSNFSTIYALFPKYVNRVRLVAEHNNPRGDRNKGRICLDDFIVQYN